MEKVDGERASGIDFMRLFVSGRSEITVRIVVKHPAMKLLSGIYP